MYVSQTGVYCVSTVIPRKGCTFEGASALSGFPELDFDLVLLRIAQAVLIYVFMQRVIQRQFHGKSMRRPKGWDLDISKVTRPNMYSTPNVEEIIFKI